VDGGNLVGDINAPNDDGDEDDDPVVVLFGG
jgi:hypothetical protein